MDDNAIQVILGAELQDWVRYGMPVKDGRYDMPGCMRQTAEIKRSSRKENASEEGEITVDHGVPKIRLTSGGGLSGLRKDDKLIPIITAAVYFADEPGRETGVLFFQAGHRRGLLCGARLLS